MINKVELLGGVLMQMDCIEGMKSIPDCSVDLVVTDPPYLIEYKTNHRNDKSHRFNLTIENDDNEQLIKEYIKECYRIMKANTAMYMFCSHKTVDFFKQELEKYFTIKNMIIWVKNNWTAGDLKGAFGFRYEIIFLVNKGRKFFSGKRLNDVWEFDRVAGNSLLHQNQKPLELIEQCILKHSDKGDVVFDGFFGSGTTGEAAYKHSRRWIGFEKDEYYFKIAKERLEGLIPY